MLFRGPASYFPSIEAKYGRSIAEWKDLIRSQSGKSTWNWSLGSGKSLGHGHANALVGYPPGVTICSFVRLGPPGVFRLAPEADIHCQCHDSSARVLRKARTAGFDRRLSGHSAVILCRSTA
ncbi:DUF4287 domain-containing protein (plasmid) [Agrobacterium salinitolerans]|nr:DUF4287 domain-containing protein [Agrobacterium salinitolerans]